MKENEKEKKKLLFEKRVWEEIKNKKRQQLIFFYKKKKLNKKSWKGAVVPSGLYICLYYDIIDRFRSSVIFHLYI